MRNTGVGIPAPVFLIGQSFASKQAGTLFLRMSHFSINENIMGPGWRPGSCCNCGVLQVDYLMGYPRGALYRFHVGSLHISNGAQLCILDTSEVIVSPMPSGR